VDLLFPSARVAVFIDGCFWHGCPIHGTWPKEHGDWWRRKLELNRERDSETVRLLEGQGWKAIRIWEHEDPLESAARIEAVVRDRRRRDR
jgi:DNA mismatch endonuclease (patch repair protein)